MLEQIVAAAKEPGLLTAIYKDLAQPGVQQVGKAIGTILGLGNTALWRVELLNEQSKAIVSANLNAYRERLGRHAVDDIAGVPAELGVPVLESLAYTRDIALRDAFVQLLEKASLRSMQHLAHPSFAWILRMMSPDEARLLELMRSESELAYIDSMFAAPGMAVLRDANFVLHVEGDIKLDFPRNIAAYVASLAGHGLLRKFEGEGVNFRAHYESLEKSFREDIGTYRPEGLSGITFTRGIVRLTDLGKLMVQALS